MQGINQCVKMQVKDLVNENCLCVRESLSTAALCVLNSYVADRYKRTDVQNCSQLTRQLVIKTE